MTPRVTNRSPRRSEKGQTLALVAVSMLSLLAMAALAIDLTTLYVARGEIQRAADAAALAGAKAFVDSGVTTDPKNTGLQSVAQTLAADYAAAVASQNKITGAPAQMASGSPVVSFTVPGNANMAGNPRITVTLQRTDLRLFFARIWGSSMASVSATAIAEAYNPSDSQTSTGAFIPAAPKCVKPFLVTNNDPVHGGAPFVDTSTGAVTNPSVLGEQITLTSACTPGQPNCVPPGLIKKKSLPPGEYLPLQLPDVHQYCPSSSAPGCSGGGNSFQSSIECCDGAAFDFQQCGASATMATWDITVNPANGSAQQGLQCLIHTNPGQDTLSAGNLVSGTGPPQISPGSFSQTRYSVAAGSLIGTSDSIITVPLFDNSSPPQPNRQVVIVGFLQLFVNSVGPAGDVDASILNVSGCGNTIASVPAVSGGGVSAIPVRLIHK